MDTNVDKKVQWSSQWNSILEKANEQGNIFLYNQVLDGKQSLIILFKKTFQSELDKIFTSNEAVVKNLKDVVPTRDAFLRGIDIRFIEDAERLRLMNFFLSEMSNACTAIVYELYNVLESYVDVLIKNLSPEVSTLWNLALSVSINDCQQQVESHIMRVLYPLVHAVLRWDIGRGNVDGMSLREKAVIELYDCCPEIFYNQPAMATEPGSNNTKDDNNHNSKPTLSKIPVAESIFNIAETIGILRKLKTH